MTYFALTLAAALVAASAQAQRVNVNFYASNGGMAGIQQTGLEGVLGDPGEFWNQNNGTSGSGLFDSNSNLTTVAFSGLPGSGWGANGPNLSMLVASRANFTKGQDTTLIVTGLDPGEKYDVYLYSHNQSTSPNERPLGTWATTNATASASSQLIDARPIYYGNEFVYGINYVYFEDVVANSSGSIKFTGDAADVDDFDTLAYRLHLNGLQIMPSPIREPLELTSIVHDPISDQTTLTWKSNPGQNYGLYWSEGVTNFVPGINPAIPANAITNRTSYGPFASPKPQAGRLFYRVGPADLVDPELRKVWGAGTNITLTFSEAMHPVPATNAANYSILKNGSTPVPFTGVTLSPDGRTVTLGLTGPLDVATVYDVTMNNLTDVAGRLLGNPTTGNFQTYDNNPNGVKVFILAGQSNMVGHGNGEQGTNSVPGAIGSLRYMVTNNLAEYGRLLVDTNNPTTSPWVTREDVKVWWRYSDITAARAVVKGDLKFGYAEGRNPAWFGPEYAFGWVLGDYYTNPVLLLKTSWGGKSLNVDYRPPSAVADRGGVVGAYYTGMIEYVRDCLSNLDTEFPEFAGMGYQIVGFGWHQGYNDRIDVINSFNYETNLFDLINDLRTEFSITNLPVAIGTTGMAITGPYSQVEQAQLNVANPSLHPWFAGTVFTDDTRPHWRDASISPSNFGYHWNHNGETHYLIGKGMGQGMTNLLGSP